MSIDQTVQRFPAGSRHDPAPALGRVFPRVDGPAKVTGSARYTADERVENLTHATVVHATIPRGQITAIRTKAAEEASGVIVVITHKNAPTMKAPSLFGAVSSKGMGTAGSSLPPLQSAEVRYDGEPVALVVAETPEQADSAASLVEVEYAPAEAAVSFAASAATAPQAPHIQGGPTEVRIGDVERAAREAAVTVQAVYRTPRHNHNAMEPHATVATWTADGRLDVLDPTQSLSWSRDTLAEVFDLAVADVRVRAPFIGGGFGGKTLWANTLLTAAAARVVGRPVRLVLTRESVYRIVGGRSVAEQRVSLSAHRDGRLAAIAHTGTSAAVDHNPYPEPFTFSTRHLYASDALLVDQRLAYLHTTAPTYMRGPGDAIGTFALESAIDELAHELGMDPVALRRRNEPDVDPTEGTPFSKRALNDVYERGAERFGWEHRPPRSRREGRWSIGQGVASAFYPGLQFPATARVRVDADGTALVSTAAHEMGMGTATVQIQVAADRLGLAADQVSFASGDSALPDMSPAGGSTQTVSIAAAIDAAAGKLLATLLAPAAADPNSVLHGATISTVRAAHGGLETLDGAVGETYAELVARSGTDHVEAEAAGELMDRTVVSIHSWGAHFCEVRVAEDSGEVRVSRWLGAFDCGRILNPRTAASQFRGGIVGGLGMALTEETHFDERRGRIMNPSLAEYHVPVHLDVPRIDVMWDDRPDPNTPLGARGIGEIGITGVAAAVANAVFNATGQRVRDLPLTPDKLNRGPASTRF